MRIRNGVILLTVTSCLAALPGVSSGQRSGHGDAVKEYRLTGRGRQVMDGFGASDAWSMQHTARWSERDLRCAADWLFSRETDSAGQPKGIGLSIWRFNIGAGSSGQGDSSCINPGTRTECLLAADGSYDWSRQAAERRFMRMAKERGVETFIGFVNSPPVYFTKNGLATNTGRGATLNLKERHYGDYARFLANVVEGVERHDGVHFDYVCPVNEPDGHWNWTGPKQEGTPATNREIAAVVRALDGEFTRRGIATKLLVNESSDYRCMFSTHIADWQRGYAIQNFFCPDSADTYIGGLPTVARMMAGHSYWTNTPLEALVSIRRQLADTLRLYNMEYWQTETCIMGNDTEIGGGGGYDFSMRTALYVARVIHHDLCVAGARSWQWWRAAGGDYKDGLLRMYERERRFRDSKLLWALGNYSLFVRPGAVRMDIEAVNRKGKVIEDGESNVMGLMCSAFQNRDGRRVVVVINYSDSPLPFRMRVSGKSSRGWRLYRTSDADGENLKPVGEYGKRLKATVAPRSVNTFVEMTAGR